MNEQAFPRGCVWHHPLTLIHRLEKPPMLKSDHFPLAGDSAGSAGGRGSVITPQTRTATPSLTLPWHCSARGPQPETPAYYQASYSVEPQPGCLPGQPLTWNAGVRVRVTDSTSCRLSLQSLACQRPGQLRPNGVFGPGLSRRRAVAAWH